MQHYVEHYRVVCVVEVMAVVVPVRGAYMHLHISGPALAVDFNGCVEEIGSGIVVERSLVKHTHATSVHGVEVAPQAETVVPYEVHESLHSVNGRSEPVVDSRGGELVRERLFVDIGF